MAWSTRQLAELAGSTVKAIRHYHEIGLLPVPERASNGYKQYGASHLIRLTQIKRLTDLGVPLAQVAAMENADEDPDEAIRVLDAELEATVDRLNRVRAELAVLVRHRAPMHVPTEFAPISRTLSETQHRLLLAYSTVFSEQTMAEYRRALSVPDDAEDDFDALPADADEDTIDRLAERMLPRIREIQREYPRLIDPAADSPLGPAVAANTMAHVVVEFYNAAQIKVLQRLNGLAAQDADGDVAQKAPESSP
ncbi:helix-turn-helix domain-containing protein [Prauserella cavernicola]|uniref:MerR family transcriptional regulator n=1 Tax=Prauserella cavernicola TaxID=2800127 RepID=A0A934QUD5_9PSEU|nr:MerR family transcriptional regulator [Prauserella cavernicola]MBK1786665.1 MerR family transcriptional regulator [Prauserella cavernicola]